MAMCCMARSGTVSRAPQVKGSLSGTLSLRKRGRIPIGELGQCVACHGRSGKSRANEWVRIPSMGFCGR